VRPAANPSRGKAPHPVRFGSVRVVYNSFAGRYSDNPRAIYEALVAEGGAVSHVWLADPAHRHLFPDGIETVEFDAEHAVRELETADVIVSNTHIELDWRKRDDALYLQTWHGTPLKHIHFDSVWAPPGRVDYLTLDVRRWDVLLSPNRASTAPLRRAFGFTGEVLETGYPRNDVLCSPHRDEVRRRVRAALGLADDVVAVLYTPTWRDDVLDADGRQDFVLGLDLDDFAARLGPGHVLLLRLHPLIASDRFTADRPGVLNVSWHPDVADLYLAADLMVTDYSSTMFDFAVTGKPLIFFAYDYDHYRDHLRGFYFDITEDPPGPIVRTSAEVVGAIADPPPMSDAYRRFQERFCSLEDGHATERVLKRCFAG
jgi:CDP-glycerol glycerophosphotransferase